MRPVHVRSLSPEMLAQISSRACSLQGLAETQYHLLHANERTRYERGTYNVLAALEALGFTIVAPAVLGPRWEVRGG